MIKSTRSRTQHHQDLSLTQRLVLQLGDIAHNNNKQKQRFLTQQRKHRSTQFHRKKLQDVSGNYIHHSFKPTSTQLQLFYPTTPLSKNQIFIPSIRNIERKSKNNRFKIFKAGTSNMDFFSDHKFSDKDKNITNLKFQDYCNVIDQDDPQCRQKRLIKYQLKFNKRPMNFQTTNNSFTQTFNNFNKQIEFSKSKCSTGLKWTDIKQKTKN